MGRNGPPPPGSFRPPPPPAPPPSRRTSSPALPPKQMSATAPTPRVIQGPPKARPMPAERPKPPTAIACGNCGQRLRPGAKFCPRCGSNLPENHTRVLPPPPPAPPGPPIDVLTSEGWHAFQNGLLTLNEV